MAKFMPGPWLQSPEFNAIDGNDDKLCAIRDEAEGYVIAEVCGDVPEAQANADLLRTAPDMYKELFRALAVINSPESFDVEGVKYAIARVLQQARGEK